MNFSVGRADFRNETTFELSKLNFHSYIASMVIYSLAIVLHMTGLSALYLHKAQTNQKLILFNLSLGEVIICVTGIFIRTNEEMPYLGNNGNKALYTVHFMSIFELISTMYLLTVDRLVFVINPLQYKARVTNRTIRIAASLTWLNSTTLSLISLSSIAKLYVYYIVIGISGGYVLLAIVTYSIILFTLRRSITNIGRRTRRQNTESAKQYLVPGVIVITYFLLYIIPSSFRTDWISNQKENEVTLISARTIAISRNMLIVGMAADPLIYIFLSKQYRDTIFQCCSSRRKRKVQTSNMIATVM